MSLHLSHKFVCTCSCVDCLRLQFYVQFALVDVCVGGKCDLHYVRIELIIY